MVAIAVGSSFFVVSFAAANRRKLLIFGNEGNGPERSALVRSIAKRLTVRQSACAILVLFCRFQLSGVRAFLSDIWLLHGRLFLSSFRFLRPGH